jgi:porin
VTGRHGTSALAVGWLLCAGGTAGADEQQESLSANVLVAAAVQCQVLTEGRAAPDACRGGAPVQPEISLSPTGRDTFHLKLGLAAWNGLADVSPLVLAPWAADLHDDVRNVNGSARDYLLTAWWRHRFPLATGNGVAATVGLVDATDYLDDNAYANDEYTQFMNEALVNGPNAFLPSYDPGGALELDLGPWSVRGVAMRVAEDSGDDRFGFFGGQVAYRSTNAWGEGNYRLLVTGTSEDVLDPEGDAKERRAAVMLSFDQELGRGLGAFLRLGRQMQDASDGYRAVYSGGVDVDGSAWGRSGDNVGLAYAYLDAGGDGLHRSQVAEIYYRWAWDETLAVTLDLQYLRDESDAGPAIGGLIPGLRVVIGL